MEWWQAILLGLVQGLTEFLPVSSSGHLVLVQELLDIHLRGERRLAFSVAVHGGTLLALIVYFRSDLANIARAFLASVRAREMKTTDQRLAWFILLGTLPALALYAALGPQLEQLEHRPVLVASMLVGFSVVFLLAEWLRRDRPIAALRWWEAVLVGCAQAIALVPGVSRSGATISAGMLLGFERQQAARFAFLLATPVVFAAFVKELPDIATASGESTQYLIAVVLGFVTAALSGYVAVAALLRFLGAHSLAWFAAYRIPVGTAFLAWLLLR